MQQAKFMYYSLWKLLDKPTKPIEDFKEKKKQTKAIEDYAGQLIQY